MNFGVGATFFRGSFDVEGVFAFDPSVRGVDFRFTTEGISAEGFGDTDEVSTKRL